jgi:hypothetical protein
VLAIVAEPPEVAPGGRVALRVVAGGLAEPVAFHWTVCARPEEISTVLPLSSFGQFEPDRGCDSAGAAGVQALGEGSEVSFEVPHDSLSRQDWLAATYGADLPRETLDDLAHAAGVPLVFTVEFTHRGTMYRAFKRVPVTIRENRNHNPPPPRSSVDGRALAVDPNGERDLCVPVEGGPLVVPPGRRVLVSPAPGEDPWLEEYLELDAEGVPTPRREQAFYNFFATAGRWDLGRARAPERNPSWTAPTTAGVVTHWLVVRDGRGGTAVCRYRVEVR